MAHSKLEAFAYELEGGAFARRALEEYFGLVEGVPIDPRTAKLTGQQTAQVNFTSYLLFARSVEQQRSVLELFINRNAPQLGRGERAWLLSMLDSRLDLFEVLEVAPSQGLRVASLLHESEPTRVSERAATGSLVKWDIVGTRLARGSTGETVIDGEIHLFRPQHKAEVLRELRKRRDTLTRTDPGHGAERFAQELALLLQRAWMRLYVFAPLPKFVSVEGEPITLSRTRYEVADRDEVIRALDSVPELTRDGEARWSWSLRSKDVLRCLGNITLHIDELELEAHTESRSRELAAIVETASGRWIRRASVTQTDPWTQIEQKRHRGEDLSAESPESDLPEQVVDQARAQFEERYMREWLDTPLPALGNRTPRHAARLKTQRGKVVELLKILDNDLARDALQGRSGFDSSKLWIELGLEEFRS